MLIAKLKLAYSNSFNRANSSAGIATHALILTDYGFTVLDGINGTGAGSSTCTTSDAFISVNRNHIHLRTSPFQIKLDCSQKIMKSQQPNTFEMNVLKHIPIIPYLRQFCKRISANFDKYIISFSSLDASLINLLFINESISQFDEIRSPFFHRRCVQMMITRQDVFINKPIGALADTFAALGFIGKRRIFR